MAQALGMQTLAEGVDNSEQYNFLSSIGCNYIQGYYISKPLPGELSRSLLQEMAAQNGLLQPEV
jgi:EAL domain-containing protein (putative c-di-GMP-specific phosphodiesterase class I)